MELYNHIYILNQVICPSHHKDKQSFTPVLLDLVDLSCLLWVHFYFVVNFLYLVSICCLLNLICFVIGSFPIHLSTYYLYLLAIQPPLAIPAVVRQFGKILKFLFFFSDLSVESLRCELKVLRLLPLVIKLEPSTIVTLWTFRKSPELNCLLKSKKQLVVPSVSEYLILLNPMQ